MPAGHGLLACLAESVYRVLLVSSTPSDSHDRPSSSHSRFPDLQSEESDGDVQFSLSLCINLAVGLCVCSHLMPEEAFLMPTGRSSNLSI